MALRKTNGGVWEIVVGDVVKRLQLGPSIEAAIAPPVCSLHAWCIAHVIQCLIELNPEATVLSIDGISAYDHISLHVQ